jgi:cytidine deaminase
METLDLIKKARKVKSNAYQPYSNYSVGAVVLTESGEEYKGVNIENITLDMCSHAERTAIKAAITDGNNNFNCLAISTESEDGAPPCLTCRQYLVEFCSDSFTIYSDKGNDEYETYKLGDIAPSAFRPENVQNEDSSNF